MTNEQRPSRQLEIAGIVCVVLGILVVIFDGGAVLRVLGGILMTSPPLSPRRPASDTTRPNPARSIGTWVVALPGDDAELARLNEELGLPDRFDASFRWLDSEEPSEAD